MYMLRVCAAPRNTCGGAHTRVPPDRACLCGDPNEGRQASKLGRAAAARAAILLESGWKNVRRGSRRVRTGGGGEEGGPPRPPRRWFPFRGGGGRLRRQVATLPRGINTGVWCPRGGREGGGGKGDDLASEFREWWTRTRREVIYGSSGDRRRKEKKVV